MDLISVIVPVYKVEKYLDKCIESIVNQTYTNIEIILVDDGSPDKSGEICDFWAEKDERIKVIHQENCGGGAARNAGIEAAKGKYITFVDSDDYISPIMMETLKKQFIEDIDIVECDYIEVYDDNESFNRYQENKVEFFDAIRAMGENIKDSIFRQLIWNKMYTRKVIGDVRFVQGKKIDDEFFTYQVIGNSKNLVRINQTLYAYRQQEESIMHNMTLEKRIQAIEAKFLRHKYVCKNFPMLKEQSLLSLSYQCLYQGQQVVNNHYEYKTVSDFVKKIMSECDNNKIKRYHLASKDLLWLCMMKISFKMTCKIRNIFGIGC